MRLIAPVVAASEADSPKNAFGLLQRRVTAAVVGILLLLALAAWLVSIRNALEMSSMAMGLGQIGSRMPDGVAAPIFLGMWLAMMVAMMFPTVAPIVLAHRMVVQKRGEGWLPTAAFVIGYLAVWTLIGLVPLAVLLGFRSLPMESISSPWLLRVAGVVLLVAGAYQFTPWKATCLKACRTPLGFMLSHDFSTGTVGAVRAGMAHGAYCVGCCWALMSVLVVVGLMNLVWMAALALVFLAEKNWRHGVTLTRVTGVAIAVLGLAVIAFPQLLAAISSGLPGPVTGGHM
jgi:predicted metal-binding membrane protein